MSRHKFRGCTIILSPVQTADGQWTCQYAISEFGNPESASKTGCPDGTFPSCLKAEAAALTQAQLLIH
jgi:hypothetical protein